MGKNHDSRRLLSACTTHMSQITEVGETSPQSIETVAVWSEQGGESVLRGSARDRTQIHDAVWTVLSTGN